MKSRLDVTMVKAQNRRLVFDAVVAGAPTSRAAIAEQTHLSAGTVATILDELAQAGVIREVVETSGARLKAVGRKPHRVEFLPKAGRILCVDLASRTPSYSFVDLALATESSRHFTRAGREGYEHLLRRLLEEVRSKIGRTGAMPEQARPLWGVGVSVPGPFRSADDRVSCKLIPELNGIGPRALLREYLDCPILIDHDVKLALASEVRLIPSHEQKTILALYLGEGVGSAISINGTVFGGAHEFAGEIGQMGVCGGETLEAQVSWTSFLARTGISLELPEAELNEELMRRYQSADPRLAGELEHTIRTVAEALANVICVLNPHAVIVSGPYALFGDRFVTALREATEARLIDDLKRDLLFMRSRYSEKGPLIGAAAMVRSSWLDNQFARRGLVAAADGGVEWRSDEAADKEDRE